MPSQVDFHKSLFVRRWTGAGQCGLSSEKHADNIFLTNACGHWSVNLRVTHCIALNSISTSQTIPHAVNIFAFSQIIYDAVSTATAQQCAHDVTIRILISPETLDFTVMATAAAIHRVHVRLITGSRPVETESHQDHYAQRACPASRPCLRAHIHR